MRRFLATTMLTLVLAAAPAALRAEDAPEGSDGIGVLEGIGTYFMDRGNDLLDIFRLRLHLPEHARGLGIKARATVLAQLGFVWYRGETIGMERRAIGIHSERRTEGGVSVFYGSLNEMEPLHGNSYFMANSSWSNVEDRRIVRNLPYWDDGRMRPLGIGAEVVTPILGLDAGIYPEEAIDFVLGWFFIDAIFDDDELFLTDVTVREAKEPRRDDPSAPFTDKKAKLKAFDERKALEAALSNNSTGTTDTMRMETPPAKESKDAEGELNDAEIDEETAEQLIRRFDEGK